MNYNINLNEQELEILISKLEQDNEEVLDIIDQIELEYIKLDESRWRSEEKHQMDEVMIPYLKEIKENVPLELGSMTNILTEALENYRIQNKNLENSVNDLPSIGG